MVHIVELETVIDDDSDWENLASSDKDEVVTNEASAEAITSFQPHTPEHPTIPIPNNLHQRTSDGLERETGVRQDRIRMRQGIAEARSKIRQDLVNHPLRTFATRFGFHLVQELWRLDMQIHLSFVLIILGVVWKILLLSTWYLWFPRAILLGLLMITSFLYVNPQLYNLEYWVELFSSTERLFECLGPDRLRNALCLLLFVPAILEMRAVFILTNIIADSGGLFVILCATLMLSTVFVLALNQKLTPRDGKLYDLLLLYVVALFSSLFRLHVGRVYFLGAPFCFTTGVLLLISHQEKDWFSRVVRYALRLSLVDTFQSLGNSVREDEMLQLALLRWIVDYWSNSPSEQTDGRTIVTTSSSGANNALVARPSRQNSAEGSALVSRPAALGWTELFPMLSMTAEQIQIEVDSLQSLPLPQSPPSTPPSSSHPSTPPSSSHPPPASVPSAQFQNESVQNLRTLLASMNIDERAKPAVVAYRDGVRHLPPAHRVAVLWATSRRCPALITFMYCLLLGNQFRISALLLLLPLIGTELLSIHRWFIALQKAHDPTSSKSNFELLDHIHPMVILLSDDEYNPSKGNPSLLQVWYNIEDSVTALETGLMAARCVQTTAIAVDFAGNIFSLIQFGIEVSQRGWMHGLAVLFREMSEDPYSGSYTTAARRAYGNSQSLSQNLRLLSEEDAHGRVIMPLLQIIPTFFAALFPGFQSSDRPASSRTLHEQFIEEYESSTPQLVEDVKNDHNAQEQGESVKDEDKEKSLQSVPCTIVDQPCSDGVIALVSDEQADGVDAAAAIDSGSPSRGGDQVGRLTTSTQVPEENLEGTSSAPHIVEKFKDVKESKVERDSDRVPRIMESISKCHIEGLIDTKEKDELCERLVQWAANEAGDSDVLIATENTLNCLLRQHEASDATVGWSPMSVMVDDVGSRKQTGSGKIRHDKAVDPGSAVQLVPVQSNDVVEIKPDASMDADFDQLESKVTEDDDFVPLDNISFEVGTSPQENQSECNRSPQLNDGDIVRSGNKDVEDENMWVKVGGALAVLGAVVGGIALLAANSGEDKRKRNGETADGVHRVDSMANS